MKEEEGGCSRGENEGVYGKKRKKNSHTEKVRLDRRRKSENILDSES